MTLAKLIRAKFVFHNEGFYPEEQVDAGNWGIESKQYRYSKKLENTMYKRADAVLVLSERSRTIVEELNDNVEVVPSCVDLDHFQGEQITESEDLSLVYLGSIGGRYDLASIGRFAATAVEADPSVNLRIFSKSDEDLVRSELAESGLDKDDWSLESVASKNVPSRLEECDAGIHFLKAGIGEIAGSPTKIGEYWAMGLPVIVTPMLGDVDSIVERNHVGVVVREHNPDSYREAFKALKKLLEDPELADRCRKTASEYYGLEAACNTQIEVYKRLLAS